MSIKPTGGPGAGSPSPLDPSQIGRARSTEATRPEVKPVDAAANAVDGHDRVEVSDAARELSEGAKAGASGLTAARVKEVVDRISTGFYDQPEVLDRVVERILKDRGL